MFILVLRAAKVLLLHTGLQRPGLRRQLCLEAIWIVSGWGLSIVGAFIIKTGFWGFLILFIE